MGGGKPRSQKKGSFSLFGLFSKPRGRGDAHHHGNSRAADYTMSPRKVWPSDYDTGKYVAEPGIDRKASAFIAKFHENRISESEHQTKAA